MKHLTEKGKNQAGIIAGVSSIGISLVGFLVSLVRLAYYGNDNNGVVALRVSNETAGLNLYKLIHQPINQ